LSAAAFDDGGPAFPWGEHGSHLGGLSTRAYAAIHLAAGIRANPAHADHLHDHDATAEIAVEGADALIRALHTPPQQVVQPFKPDTLTNDERAAMDRLTNWSYFDDLPADLKEQANRTAIYLKNQLGDDSLPF